MKYIDRVYGKCEITEPVVLELINSSSMQRLKHVDQYGYFEPFAPGRSLPRFEHSLGVYLLLKKYDAPLPEQIAGLIHDISHAVFSHAVDYALDPKVEHKQKHQDNIFADFVRNSELPEVFKKFDLDLEYILNEKNFPLKERDLPDLCADRIDYIFRDAMVFGELDDASYFLNNLVVKDNQWIFKDFASVKKYADLFARLNSIYYSGIDTAVDYRTVGDCLRYALSHGYLSEIDLYTTDLAVLDRIEGNLGNDNQLSLLFDRMNNRIHFKIDPVDYNARISVKSRAVDPLCYHNGKIQRVSGIEPSWKEIMVRESKPKEYFIKFDK